MDLWSKSLLKSLLVPGGVLLLAAVLLLHTGVLTTGLAALTLTYRIAMAAGLLLCWRFQSSRVFFALITVFLAQEGISLFSSTHADSAAHIVIQAAALLIPLNWIATSVMRERGFTSSGVVPIAITIFVESVVAAALSSGVRELPGGRHHGLHAIQTMPGYAWAAFAIASVILLSRFILFRKPVEVGLFWSLVAVFIALHFGGVDKLSLGYFAASALVLGVSIVETSYFLAYHDELTALPSRRAFKEALLRIRRPFSIAVVDIDHFKSFNDTYGHDTGDEVLRLVASRLARVTGGGTAFRCGGEEFSILFNGKITKEVLDDLELLRATIESSAFHVRGKDRRQQPRGAERRKAQSRGRARQGRAIRQLAVEESRSKALSVTVSIGVATCRNENEDPQQIIEAADRALYRAKAAGRNRIETASTPRRKAATKAAGIA